jgi:multisubunit Na+/H+ antiporter MnhC subunit
MNMPIPLETLFFVGAVGLVGIGVTGMLVSRHLFRVLLSLTLAEAGGNLLLVLAGFRWDAVAPILTGDLPAGAAMVDPVPQALVLTSIVIGVGLQALAVALLIRIRRAYGTLDVGELAGRLKQDIDADAGVPPDRSPEAPRGKQPFPPPAVSARQEAGR